MAPGLDPDDVEPDGRLGYDEATREPEGGQVRDGDDTFLAGPWNV
jgi:hypothetical protein